MREVELFAGMLVVVVLLALVAYRVRRIPHAVALAVGGTVIGVVPFVAEIEIDPDLVFLVFLPPILYPSAYAFSAEEVRGSLRAIGFLAVGLVLVTVLAVAAALHFLAGVAWAPAFVVGAVLAPTDPVAATGVIRASGAPTRLVTILEGESLVNDGTALTALRIAIGAVGGSFALVPAAGELLLVAFGGAAIGAVLAWLTAELLARVEDVELSATITVLLAYGAFLLAEALSVSGVLATVLAGLVMGRRADVNSPLTRVGGGSFWNVARFLAESMLFVLVGLAFGQAIDDSATRPAIELVGLTALVVAVTVGVRFAFMFGAPPVAALLDPTTRELGSTIRPRGRVLISFAGMRGAVSVAAALSIPATVDGTDFPERDTLIVVALSAIILMLVVPALLLPYVVRHLGLEGAEDLEARERQLRSALAEAALSRAEERAAEHHVPEDVLDHVRSRYELRIERFADAHGDDPPDEQRADALRELWRATLAAQREELRELSRRGEVNGELLRTLEHDLDLEEARLR